MPLNVYCTLRQVDAPDVPVQRLNRRDRGNPALLPHLRDFVGYLTHDGRMDQARYHLVQHVLRTQHQLSFEVDAAGLPSLAGWMERSNGVCFREDGSVRDPQGRVLFDPKTGHADPEARLPYPADAVARKRAVMAELAGHGITPLAALPPVIGEGEVDFRPGSDVAHRALALMVTAVRGESLVAGKPVSAATLRSRLPQGFDSLTPVEQAVMSDGGLLKGGKRPDRNAMVQATWRYESAAVLFWALGLRGDLPFPDQACSASNLSDFTLALDARSFVSKARLRPAADILHELDRAYRLNWLATEVRVNGRKTALHFDPGVVLERHYALNWLTRFEDADWDDVTTPT